MSRSKRLPPPVEDADEVLLLPPLPEVPAHWSKGALLNVRGTGDGYTVTQYPEEFDSRYPERAMKFTNTGQCQDFVSRWYAREHADPRAV